VGKFFFTKSISRRLHSSASRSHSPTIRAPLVSRAPLVLQRQVARLSLMQFLRAQVLNSFLRFSIRTWFITTVPGTPYLIPTTVPGTPYFTVPGTPYLQFRGHHTYSSGDTILNSSGAIRSIFSILMRYAKEVF